MPTSSTERQPLLSPQPKGVNIPPSHPAYEALQSARKNAAIPCDPSRTPAVGDSLTPVKATEDDEEEHAETAPTPAERRRSLLRWLAFWAVLTGFVTFLIVQAVRKGGGEFDWKGALKKAGGGGLAGGLAMVLQVLTLMPLRTVMNYQYRYGTTTTAAAKKLHDEGGWRRYYAGLGPALVQGPIARFGDTAANAGILALLSSNPFLSRLPSPLKTAFASAAGALFRMVLMPVDTLKTTMQTQGSQSALVILKERVKRYGPGTLWAGAWATAAANFVGSFPWFATYNYLQGALPPPPPDSLLLRLLRQALIGFTASLISDTLSNCLRVVKTYRQVSRRSVGYAQAARIIVSEEGLKGLFGRGLRTRILANGLQGLMFAVLWKAIADGLAKRG